LLTIKNSKSYKVSYFNSSKMKQKAIFGLVACSFIFIILVSGCSESGVKVGCKQITKYKIETYEVTEEYNNCDAVSGCECIHESWGGLGSCDTCRCAKTRKVPYQVEECWGD